MASYYDDLTEITNQFRGLSLNNNYGITKQSGAKKRAKPVRIYFDPYLLGLNSHMEMMSLDNIVEYKTLKRNSQKFQQIASKFPPSMQIVRIEKVSNPFLRLSYELKRIFKYSNQPPLKLFHGTKAKYVHSICTTNLNWRLSGTERGYKFGLGVNFTEKPKFALNFCDTKSKEKVIIMADVLVRNTIVGCKGLSVPPEGFDTTVGPNKNKIFVKFCDNEFYPTHVIYIRKVYIPPYE